MTSVQVPQSLWWSLVLDILGSLSLQNIDWNSWSKLGISTSKLVGQMVKLVFRTWLVGYELASLDLLETSYHPKLDSSSVLCRKYISHSGLQQLWHSYRRIDYIRRRGGPFDLQTYNTIASGRTPLKLCLKDEVQTGRVPRALKWGIRAHRFGRLIRVFFISGTRLHSDTRVFRKSLNMQLYPIGKKNKQLHTGYCIIITTKAGGGSFWNTRTETSGAR